MTEILLPEPDPAFEWQDAPNGLALICQPLAIYAQHLFTTRPWALGSRPSHLSEAELWREVAAAIDLPPERLVRMRQVHGADAIEALPGAPLQPADIVITDHPELVLAVQAADCVPLLIVDVHTGAAAAVHAGWRGMAARAPQRAVEALARTYGSRPENLIAAAGPSIGACCYEVGTDLRQAFIDKGFALSIDRWFSKERGCVPGNPSLSGLPLQADEDHWFFDGWRCVADQLQESGIGADCFYAPRLCTASHPAVFCSHRRDGASAGRMAAVIRSATRMAGEA